MNNVNLKLYNKTYKLKVTTAQEEIIRARANSVNNLIENYKKQFPQLSDFDFLALAVINDWAENLSLDADIQQIKLELDIVNNILK